ncbi:MAG: ATP-binding protein [Candidatus Methanoplasma sp.]|nr:ATP-binding protein [Candidatus Methanoplasma sp.]
MAKGQEESKKQGGGDVRYYQVAWTINDSNINREIGNLEAVPDNYPKAVITTDPTMKDSTGGIRIVNHIDFLLETDT